MTMFTKNDIVYNKSGLTKESQVANALAQVSNHVLNIKGSKRGESKTSAMPEKTISKNRCILTFSHLNIYLSLCGRSQGLFH